MKLGPDNYPGIPQITSATNASWSGGVLLVTDYTKAVTITWNNPGNTSAFFGLNNTGIQSSGGTLNETSFTIPAGSLQNNTGYQGNINLTNGTANGSSLPGTSSFAGDSTQVNFVLQTGTMAKPSKSLYDVEKEHVEVQSSNAAPVDGSGENAFEKPAPYNISFQSLVSGTVTGPSSTSYVLTDQPNNNSYKYQSPAFASQSALNASAPDGSYTLPGSGGTVSLTGTLYPAAAQVTQVNGTTPVWDNQGQLVLNPAIQNTITWSSVTVPNFSTDGYQNVKFGSTSGNSIVQESAGLTTSTTTPYTTLVIPANSMTLAETYSGDVSYGQASTFNTINSTTFACPPCTSPTIILSR